SGPPGLWSKSHAFLTTRVRPRRSGRAPGDNPPVAESTRMIFLGFGKYARADKIYALEPLGEGDRGHGRRTRVWIEGVPDPIVAVALAYQVYKLTGSTLAVGLISLTHLVPLLTLTVIGGAIADAVDRSRLMLLQQLGMIAGSIGLAANAALSHPHVWLLYVLQ